MWKTLKSSIVGDYKITQHSYEDYCLVAGSEERFFLAVADGHGGTPYCRSADGAKLACLAASEILLGAPTVPWAEVTGRIKELFDRKVCEELKKKPLGEKEKALLNGRPEESAYGTTLICCCMTPNGCYRAQIGDGEIHVLTEAGTFLRNLPDDARCVGFYTTSLVSPNAASQFRWSYDEVPAAVAVLFTDGYVHHTGRPWQLLDLTNSTSETIPQNVLDAGWVGDDQTILLAMRAEAVTKPAFHDSYAAEYTEYTLRTQMATVLGKCCAADIMITHYIQRLAEYEDRRRRHEVKDISRIRNRLLKRLYVYQTEFLSLSEEYRLLEKKQMEHESHCKKLKLTNDNVGSA